MPAVADGNSICREAIVGNRSILSLVRYSRGMTPPRPDIDAFLRRIAAEVRAADPAREMSHDAIAAHLNEAGLTTRNGRSWTGAIVEKFLSSPAAQRHLGHLASEQPE